MSVCTSPAIASPPTTATATGRNSGSTMPRAASGNRVPSVSTAERNGGPVPGRGPRSVSGEQHGDEGGQRVERRDRHPGRGRRSILTSSTRITSDCPPASVLGRGQHDLLEGAAHGRELRDPDAGRDQRWFSPAGSSARTSDACRRHGARPGRRAGRRRRRRRGCAPGPARSRSCRAARSSCSTSRPRSSTPTRVHICSISASRWLERKIVVPVAVQPQQQLADVADALGVEAVGGLVEDQQRRAAHQRAAPARAAGACRASRPSRGAGRRVEARPARAPRRSRARRRARSTRGPGRRRRRARGWRARTGGGRRRVPRPAHRPAAAPTRPPSASARRGARPRREVASTRPSSIRTVVVLPDPLAPRKP